MELSEFARLSSSTDIEPNPAEGLRIALFGLAGEAGSVVSEAKKWYRERGPREGLEARVSEELGDLLWYVAAVARRLGLDLDEVAAANLYKNAQLWADDLGAPPSHDAGFPPNQRLPRRLRVRFTEELRAGRAHVRMIPLDGLATNAVGEMWARDQLGDDLDDNSASDDGYRYHDVLHLAHASVLGWSPVLRALTGAKRKADSDTDRIQDGARAVAIEEGLAAFVFSHAEDRGFLAGADRLDWDLIKHARRMVRGLEVASQPYAAWQRTYLQAFTVFRQLRRHHGGVVTCDLDLRTLSYDRASSDRV